MFGEQFFHLAKKKMGKCPTSGSTSPVTLNLHPTPLNKFKLLGPPSPNQRAIKEVGGKPLIERLSCFLKKVQSNGVCNC